MWSISSVEPEPFGSQPYLISTVCFSDSGTFRIRPVRKVDAQITLFSQLEEVGAG